METKEKEVLVKRVVVAIGGREITLTVDEAKKMRAALNELFGKEVIKEVRAEHHHYDRWYWNGAYKQETTPWQTPIVWCDTGTSTGQAIGGTVKCSIT